MFPHTALATIELVLVGLNDSARLSNCLSLTIIDPDIADALYE